MTAMDVVGRAVGWALAPVTAAGSFLRDARLVHAQGVVYNAEVTPLATVGPAQDIARRLRGPALVRLSSAFRNSSKPNIDLLGIAVRFRSDPLVSAELALGDQDLLLATVRSIWTFPLALITTDQSNFLCNDYYGVGPFEIEGLGEVTLRLHGSCVSSKSTDRRENLARAVAANSAVFELSARPVGLGTRYEPIVSIRLIEKVRVDQEALRFWPFNTGRGIIPRGFLHAVQFAIYPASQVGRSLRKTLQTLSSVGRKKPVPPPHTGSVRITFGTENTASARYPRNR